jgi:aminoglycoside/choline kinase family phosphotransferase
MNQVYICGMLHAIIENYFGKENIQSVTSLAQAGSNRKYFRVISTTGESLIVCENNDVAENETFLYFTQIFAEKNIPVPQIYYVHPEKRIYILEDLGNESLLDIVLQKNENHSINELYEKSLSALVSMQIQGGKSIDFTRCFAAGKFDKQAVIADLNYFKYYFLDLQEIIYNKQLLQNEFDRLAESIENIDSNYFMFRDFQGRNIMVKNGEPTFIDYQGGMQGPLQYDVASLLWQAKAALSLETKEQLYQYYKQKLAQFIPFNESEFDLAYQKILLVRLLQVMGAYGLRGLIQQRSHFVSSIPYGLQNISEWMANYADSVSSFPTLMQVLNSLTSKEIKEKYSMSKQINENKLTVTVQSFSYKKGIPDDLSGNGGGFMFDCRGILNPGRFEEYKKLTGRDQAVIEFLESKTKIHEFLNFAKKLVDISMEDYLNRGFENLQISFGCTGGQHRSVYCTDHMASYLQQKYAVQVNVRHLIQDEKNWIN